MTTFTMTKLTIYIVTYGRGTYDLSGTVKPYHWSYFVQRETKAGERLGIAHQLHGMPGSFNYQGPEEINLAQSGPLNGELEVGEIDADNIDRMHEILSKVNIDLDESTKWNCQDWALAGFEEMKRNGLLYSDLDASTVRNWLKERDFT
jgi:hypothetical protein